MIFERPAKSGKGRDNMNYRQKRIEEAMQKYFKSQEEVNKKGQHARQRQFLRIQNNWKRGSSELIRNN